MPNRLYSKIANSRMPFKTGGPTGKKFPDLSGDGKTFNPKISHGHHHEMDVFDWDLFDPAGHL